MQVGGELGALGAEPTLFIKESSLKRFAFTATYIFPGARLYAAGNWVYN